MLSGEGMQRRKTVKNNNRSNQQKSNFASAAHFFCRFLCRCFARLQRETYRDFFYGGNTVRVIVHFVHCAHFLLALVASSISHFVSSTTKFSCCSSNKKMSPLLFISRSRSLSPFSLLSSLACRFFSFSLSLSCSRA